MEESFEQKQARVAQEIAIKEEVKKLNVYQRLLLIQNELTNVAKNLSVGVGKSSYKAVGEADVLKAVKPLEAKYGVYSYPSSRRIVESAVLENEQEQVDYSTHEKVKVIKKSFFERIETVYRFVNVDNPSEYIEITSYGDGIDTGDKSVGKACTYADKYALLKAYKIITGDDPDQDESQSYTGFKKGSIDPLLIRRCNELGIELENVARYYKKGVSDLTNDDVRYCIAQKERKIVK